MGRILIVDDDPVFRMVLADILGNEGHDTVCAEDLGRAMALAGQGDVDLVFLDVRLPDGNGLDLLPRMRNLPSRPEVIIVTGVGDPDGAMLAMHNGAWDYVDKAENPQKLRLACHRALEYRRTKLAAGPVKREGIVGRSPTVMRCLDQLAQAAASTANVLILGETGTGKELFARALHANSGRAEGRFVIVDCAALHESIMGAELFGYRKGAFTGADADKPGLVRTAHGGTLFLDEVSELAPEMQKAFLRVLEQHCFRPLGHDREEQSDFRLVCASNRDLTALAASGGFREDLLYRIRAMTVTLPSLRERREDIQELVDFHLARITRRGSLPRKSVSMDLLMLFKEHPWPGNVRELVNVLEGPGGRRAPGTDPAPHAPARRPAGPVRALRPWRGRGPGCHGVVRRPKPAALEGLPPPGRGRDGAGLPGPAHGRGGQRRAPGHGHFGPVPGPALRPAQEARLHGLRILNEAWKRPAPGHCPPLFLSFSIP